MDLTTDRVALSTGVSLPYLSSGPVSGTPVVLLHAWGESRGVFDRLLPLLPSTIRALAMDQRGHGEADKPQAGYSLVELAEDVVAFLDVLGLSSAVLLGSSSGGYVAQQVAVAHPSRVAGLVLVGAPLSLQGRPSFADEVDRLTDPLDPVWVRESLAWFPRTHDIPEWYVDARVDDGLAMPAHVWSEALHGLTDARPPTDSGTITAPTLVVWGGRDDLLPRDHADGLVEAIPDSRIVVYEDTGHLVLWEQPDRVAADLVAFVESLGRRSP